MWHAANPPSNPKLLDLLATSLQSNGYNMRFLLREMALSKTYQRSSQASTENEPNQDVNYNIGLMKPLTPEQLAWSMMQATGLTATTLVSLKAKQIKADAKKGPQQVEQPQWQEEALHGALKAHVTTFVTKFGIVGAQTSRFDASADQALFLRNGPLVQSWLVPAGDNLIARLKKLESSAEIADELYLSVFSRHPNTEEIQQIEAFLKDNQQNRDSDLQQLAWAVLSSDEFRFNH
jgi:hypothetical protein